MTAGDLPPEAQLKEALLEHYDASVRPTYNTTEATRVVMDLALQQIIDVVGISSFFQPCTYTLQEENLHWSLNYTNGKFTKLKNSHYCFIFSNFSLIAYVIEIQNKTFDKYLIP